MLEPFDEDLVSQDMGLGSDGRLPRWDLMDMDGEVGEVWGEGNSVRGTGYEIEGVRLCVASMLSFLLSLDGACDCLLLNHARVPRTFIHPFNKNTKGGQSGPGDP